QPHRSPFSSSPHDSLRPPQVPDFLANNTEPLPFGFSSSSTTGQPLLSPPVAAHSPSRSFPSTTARIEQHPSRTRIGPPLPSSSRSSGRHSRRPPKTLSLNRSSPRLQCPPPRSSRPSPHGLLSSLADPTASLSGQRTNPDNGARRNPNRSAFFLQRTPDTTSA
ncbi:hypothetical protein H0E87_031221, partial [Populus deltoides]